MTGASGIVARLKNFQSRFLFDASLSVPHGISISKSTFTTKTSKSEKWLSQTGLVLSQSFSPFLSLSHPFSFPSHFLSQFLNMISQFLNKLSQFSKDVSHFLHGNLTFVTTVLFAKKKKTGKPQKQTP